MCKHTCIATSSQGGWAVVSIFSGQKIHQERHDSECSELPFPCQCLTELIGEVVSSHGRAKVAHQKNLTFVAFIDGFVFPKIGLSNVFLVLVLMILLNSCFTNARIIRIRCFDMSTLQWSTNVYFMFQSEARNRFKMIFFFGC